MPFDATTLECFLAVADSKSFTKASEKVSRTQSAVSQQIIKLETQIGKPLFNRNSSITLTSYGETLLIYAKKIIKLNNEAMDRFKQSDLHGEVRFGLPEDFASAFLSDVLEKYASLHPHIFLNIECDLTVNLLNRFKKKEFDLVLVKMNKPEDFPNGIDVWSETLEWVSNNDLYDIENKDEAIPLILSPQPCVYREKAIKSLEKNNRKWKIVFSSHSYAGTVAAVKAGMGITVMSRNMIPKELKIVRKNNNIPKLDDAHISLLKHNKENLVVNSFEKFVFEILKS